MPSTSRPRRTASRRAVSRKRRLVGGSGASSSSVSRYPRIDVSGVRSSCPTVASISARSRSRRPRSSAVSKVCAKRSISARSRIGHQPVSMRRPVDSDISAAIRSSAQRRSATPGGLPARAGANMATAKQSVPLACASASPSRTIRQAARAKCGRGLAFDEARAALSVAPCNLRELRQAQRNNGTTAPRSSARPIAAVRSSKSSTRCYPRTNL